MQQQTSGSTIKFGTSGLRGPAEAFTSARIFAYIGAFLGLLGTDGIKRLYVGADLRDSSPDILSSVIATAKHLDWQVISAGNIPTPALAAYAMARDCPSIMVTGSHITAPNNGIKFYRRDGELLKRDEDPIQRCAEKLMNGKMPNLTVQPIDVDDNIARSYVDRFTTTFGASALQGLRIGVDMHSAVGRDLLVEIMEALGAVCFPFHRSDHFIAVDTEALESSDLARAQAQLNQNQLDAVISTDGDGDRPLLIDETGQQINGDILGALCAKMLRIDTVVTPLSSTSAIEKSGWFGKTVRTKIGSPYVVSAMQHQSKSANRVAGFEANGGFLLESDIQLADGLLPRLPTRDAVLPLVSVLVSAKLSGRTIAEIGASLPSRFMKSTRIKDVQLGFANGFLKTMAKSAKLRASIDPMLSHPDEIDLTDGVRMRFPDSSIVHFRQSGNAPEMRCYVETSKHSKTNNDLSRVVAGFRQHVTTSGHSS